MNNDKTVSLINYLILDPSLDTFISRGVLYLRDGEKHYRLSEISDEQFNYAYAWKDDSAVTDVD